jgi:hypothetical protein
MTSTRPRIQSVIAVLWPSFITAGVATVIFFTAFDPVDILADIGQSQMTRMYAYSVGFFLFWALTAASSLLTCYFQRPCDARSVTKPPTDTAAKVGGGYPRALRWERLHTAPGP